jgi:hypothetical protein
MLISTQYEDPYESYFMLSGIALFAMGGYLMLYGKRHLTRRGELVLKSDQRDPVVYLRSFDMQNEDFSLRKFFSSVGMVFRGQNYGYMVSTWGPTFQTQLAQVMERIGPYIAVGHPGASLPGTGAARLYIRDDEWQTEVTNLITRAKQIVLRARSSTGLEWEVETVIKIVAAHPQKLLIILPGKQSEYNDFL